MSQKTKMVPQLAGLTYAHTLVIESTHEYGNLHSRIVSNFEYTLYLQIFGPLLFSQTLLLNAIMAE